jgi:hypothetical protein
MFTVLTFNLLWDMFFFNYPDISCVVLLEYLQTSLGYGRHANCFSLKQNAVDYSRLQKVCHRAVHGIYLLYRLCQHCHLLQFSTGSVQHYGRLQQSPLVLLM